MTSIRYSLFLILYWFTTGANSSLLAQPTSTLTHSRSANVENITLSTSIHQTGWTGDICSSDADCVSPRRCVAYNDEEFQLTPCSGSSPCICFALAPCTSDSDCVESETCVKIDTSRMCVGRNVNLQEEPNSNSNTSVDNSGDNNSDDNDESLVPLDDEPKQSGGNNSDDNGRPSLNEIMAEGIDDEPKQPVPAPKCIAIHHLHEWKSHQLVYDKHYRQQVLCDENNSCATPGHMVKINDNVVMMATYCDSLAQKCKRHIMEVNSPRYRVGRVVDSYTKNLSFTVFAARYETKTEEALLSAAIRIGL